MSFKDSVNESKYTEGDTVKWDSEKWKVVEVIGKKKVKLSSLDGKQTIVVWNRELED